MSGIAKYVLSKNGSVSGSDLIKNDVTDELEKLGAKIFNEHKESNVLNADAVVVTSAVSVDNPEVLEAKRRGVDVFDRSKVLGDIISLYKNSVAIAGCHGKTTATAMISEILIEGGKDPTVFIGGDYVGAKRFRLGNSDVAVAEACEYKKNLLDIDAKIAVVLNLDNDHMDCYNGMKEMTETFRKFTEKSLAVLNADDLYLDKLFNSATVTFGIDRPATYTAKSIKYNGRGYSFSLCKHYRPIARINLQVFGWHNVYNALAACAVADLLGVSTRAVKRALEGFCGVKRRNEYLGEKYGVQYFADYAHHPSEIAATLSAYRQTGQRFFVVFQPHTYSRTKFLMGEFVNAFKDVDSLIIYKTYAAREDFDVDGSAEKLYENLKKEGCDCNYVYDIENLNALLSSLKGYDKALVLGAGDIYEIFNDCVLKK